MSEYVLDFELPLKKIQDKIDALKKTSASTGIDVDSSIDQLEKSEIEGFEFYRYTEHFSIFLYLSLACIGLELLLNFVLLKTAF